MAAEIIDIHESRIRQFIESIRPESPEIREQVDMGYSYDGKMAILFEIRPVWNNPSEKQELAFAKIRYYKSRGEWTLYWMRANGKWERYDPFPDSRELQEILNEIKADKYGCFFG